MSQTLNSPSCTSASRRAGPTSLHSGPDSPGSENAPTASPHAGVEEPWDKFLKEDLHLGPSTGSRVAQVLSGHSSPTSAQSSRSRFNSSSDSWERVSVASNPSDRYYEVDSDPENENRYLSNHNSPRFTPPGSKLENARRGYGLYSILTKVPRWRSQGDAHPFIARPASLARSNPSTSTSDDGSKSVSSIFSKAVSKLKRGMSDAEGPSEHGGSGATGATGKGGKPRWYRW